MAELETVADVVEWTARHLAGNRRNHRYQYLREATNGFGEKVGVLSHSVRESSWTGRSSKKLREERTGLGKQFRKVLDERWPVSEASGGRIPQTAMGVLRLLGTAADVGKAERRAAELERGRAEANARESRLEWEAEAAFDDPHRAREWLTALTSEFGAGYNARSAAYESVAGLEAALARLSTVRAERAARRSA